MPANATVLACCACALAILSCGDDGGHRSNAGLDASADGGGPDTGVGNDAGECGSATACWDGGLVQLDMLCTKVLDSGGGRSGGLYRVCLVDPQGRLYFAILVGDELVTSPGWTYSAHGNGNVPGTLSSADSIRCAQALADMPDGGADGEGVLSFLCSGRP